DGADREKDRDEQKAVSICTIALNRVLKCPEYLSKKQCQAMYRQPRHVAGIGANIVDARLGAGHRLGDSKLLALIFRVFIRHAHAASPAPVTACTSKSLCYMNLMKRLSGRSGPPPPISRK